MLYLKTVTDDKKDIYFDITKSKTQPYKKVTLKKTYDFSSPEVRAAVASFAYVYMMDHKESDISNIHAEELINGNFRNKRNTEIRELFDEEVSIAKQVVKWSDQDVDQTWSGSNLNICNMFRALFANDTFIKSKTFILYNSEDEDLLFEKLSSHNKKLTKDDAIVFNEQIDEDEEDDDDISSLFGFNGHEGGFGTYKFLPVDKGTALFFKLSLDEDDIDKFCINV